MKFQLIFLIIYLLRFDKNATGTEIVGGWSLKPDGKAQGPLGFGNAIKFKTEEVMYYYHCV